MKKFSFEFVIGIAFIVFVVGMGAADVGEVYECNNDPVPMWMPFMLAAITGLPFALGYAAGKDEKP